MEYIIVIIAIISIISAIAQKQNKQRQQNERREQVQQYEQVSHQANSYTPPTSDFSRQIKQALRDIINAGGEESYDPAVANPGYNLYGNTPTMGTVQSNASEEYSGEGSAERADVKVNETFVTAQPIFPIAKDDIDVDLNVNPNCDIPNMRYADNSAYMVQDEKQDGMFEHLLSDREEMMRAIIYAEILTPKFKKRER